MFVEFESQNRFVFVQLQEHNFTGRGVKCRLSAGVIYSQSAHGGLPNQQSRSNERSRRVRSDGTVCGVTHFWGGREMIKRLMKFMVKLKKVQNSYQRF